MALITPLKGVTFTAAEIAAVQAAVGSEDAVGMMSALVAELQEISAQLSRLATYVPAGANLTTIQTAITNIA